MSPAGDRDAAIGSVLEAVVTISRALVAARKTPFADVHVTATQMDALFLIAHGGVPVTPGVLASRLGVTRGAVTQLVDGLRQMELVEQLPHPSDARSRLLRLTPDAAAAVRRFEADLTVTMRPLFARLTDSDLDHLAALLTRVEAHP